jgi:hypothetical protein
MLKNTA